MSDRYEKIRQALAMGPTQGPRTLLADEGMLGRPLPGRWVVEADGGAYICLDPEWDEECYGESIANAALIAACDPDIIRDLLAERDRLATTLQAEVEALRAEVNGTIRELLAERDTLREALEIARDFVAEALARERDAYRGHESVSSIADIERYLAQIDAALAQGQGGDDAP